MNDRDKPEIKTVVYFSPTLPLPNGAGIQKRAWSHLEALSANAEVDLVLMLTSGQISRGDDMSAAAARCRTVRVLRLEPTFRARNIRFPGLTAALRISTLGAPSSRIAHSSALKDFLSDLRAHQYDLAFFFRLRTFELVGAAVGDTRNVAHKLFLDLDDIESIALKREFDTRSHQFGFEEKVLARLQQFEISIAEKKALKQVDGIGICSDKDADALRKRGTPAALVVVPNSLPNLRQLPPRHASGSTHILFLGTMTYQPNDDGAIYFCNEILPHIRAQAQQPVSTEIVGRGPSPAVKALADDKTISVTGEVDTVEPCYERADIVVVPIRFGGGTRIKILEALALGRPVVSTSIGAEGLDLVDGRDILIADDVESFAAACLRLIADPELRRKMIASGRERFSESYEASRVQKNMNAALQAIAQAPSPHRSV
jgi:glycosyltransferase involved in cell wall biosynthesis